MLISEWGWRAAAPRKKLASSIINLAPEGLIRNCRLQLVSIRKRGGCQALSEDVGGRRSLWQFCLVLKCRVKETHQEMPDD